MARVMQKLFNFFLTSLYIHIPFCGRKCFYCSFAVCVGQGNRVEAYLDCLSREARGHPKEKIKTVYLGGGTPSLLSADQFLKLARLIEENFSVEPDAEWTLEANPESVDEDKAFLWKSAGVNRVSLGIQSLNDRYLRYLGRNHDAEKARQAYRVIRDAGFSNVNVDLMFSFPGQTREDIEADAAALTALGSEHISLYMLNVEEHSRFYAQKICLPGDDEQAASYGAVVRHLEAAGYRQYEISNFAVARKESRHNLNYWQGGEYLGLGVGAHSYIDGKLSWNVDRLNTYIDLTSRGESVTVGFRQLDRRERFQQALLIGLRMNEGVDVGALQRTLACALEEEDQRKIDELTRGGFLVWEGRRLKATSAGRLVLDEVCGRLI